MYNCSTLGLGPENVIADHESRKSYEVVRGGCRDFEKRGALCWPPWLAGEKKFRFQIF